MKAFGSLLKALEGKTADFLTLMHHGKYFTINGEAFLWVLATLVSKVDYPCIADLKKCDAIHLCLSNVGRILHDVEVKALVLEK
jgi:hypothetical protein